MTIIEETVAWLTDPANWVGPSGIPVRVMEHVAISLTALVVALAIAIPIGLWVGHTGRGTRVAVNGANLFRSVPSLALIGILVPFTALIDPQIGFRVLPTLIAMIALAIPPILVNTYTGVSEVSGELTEAARGMGLTEAHVLFRLEVPLALPVILGGFGSASVQVIATATLGAIFGFGGLGTYLTEGISQNDDGMVYGGVVLVALLAVTAEGVLTLLSRRVAPPGVRDVESRDRRGGARVTPTAGRPT